MARAQDLSSTRADRPATFDMNQVPRRALDVQCSREHAAIPACNPIAVELPAKDKPDLKLRALYLVAALLLSYLENLSLIRNWASR